MTSSGSPFAVNVMLKVPNETELPRKLQDGELSYILVTFPGMSPHMEGEGAGK